MSKINKIWFYLSVDEEPFARELVSYGLSEELLLSCLSQVCNGDPPSWQLKSVPTVVIYHTLHLFKKS